MTNVYDDNKALAQRLVDSGFAGHARQLLAAMSEGATGTEIFMILRSRLSDVIRDDAVPPICKEEAKALCDVVACSLR